MQKGTFDLHPYAFDNNRFRKQESLRARIVVGASQELSRLEFRGPPEAVEALHGILERVSRSMGACALTWLEETRTSQQAYPRLLRECVIQAYDLAGKSSRLVSCQLKRAVLGYARFNLTGAPTGGVPCGVPSQGAQGGAIPHTYNPKFMPPPPTNRGMEFSGVGGESLKVAGSLAGQGQSPHSGSSAERETLDRQSPDTLDPCPENRMFSGLPSGERPKRAKSFFASDNNSYQKHKRMTDCPRCPRHLRAAAGHSHPPECLAVKYDT